jgi:hypothetical protein
LGKESWHDFLARLVEALRSDSLFVGLNDNEQMKLTAWCYHNGKQFSYTYTLLPCENNEVKAKVTDMVFDLLALARRKDKAHEQGTPPFLSLSLCVCTCLLMVSCFCDHLSQKTTRRRVHQHMIEPIPQGHRPRRQLSRPRRLSLAPACWVLLHPSRDRHPVRSAQRGPLDCRCALTWLWCRYGEDLTAETYELAAVANTVPTKAQAKGAKRKQGFSLVNPRVKRCV